MEQVGWLEILGIESSILPEEGLYLLLRETVPYLLRIAFMTRYFYT